MNYDGSDKSFYFKKIVTPNKGFETMARSLSAIEEKGQQFCRNRNSFAAIHSWTSVRILPR
jgi:hypothetical protein